MSELISGREALIASANGEEVECINQVTGMDWCDASGLLVKSFFDPTHMWEFRLKPRTISINGIEVPAPFEPKLGERYYVLQPCNESGWMGGDCADMEFDKTWSQFGAWRTKEEIQKVVEALRFIFK